MKYSLDSILAYLRARDYAVFDKDTLPLNLNIVGIRSSDKASDAFNDSLYVFFKYNGVWTSYNYLVTLDPGLVYRINPINRTGTAIIFPGQYRGLWKVGYHKGKYKALVQKSPCTVIRDNNRDSILDFEIPSYSYITNVHKGGIIYSNYIDSDRKVVFNTETGMFGINCHKSGNGKTMNIGYYSAGCVVFSDNDLFDNEFMPMCETASEIFGDSFTFTVINETELI